MNIALGVPLKPIGAETVEVNPGVRVDLASPRIQASVGSDLFLDGIDRQPDNVKICGTASHMDRLLRRAARLVIVLWGP